MKNKRLINIITTVVFLGIIFSFSFAFVIKPGNISSSKERRYLQTLPVFTFEELKTGKFSSQINEYLNDQFPLRNAFVAVECGAEKLLLKRENNGVLFGRNGQLAVRLFPAYDGKLHEEVNGMAYSPPHTDLFYKDALTAQLGVLNEFSNKLAAKNIPLSVILPPRTIDVAASAFDYPSDNSDKLIAFVREKTQQINLIDIYSEFRERYDNGEYIYYKTDHHWTTLGAYYAYVEVMKSFGMDYYEKEEFDIHAATVSFLGTTFSKSGFSTFSPDTIEYWTLREIPPENFTTIIYKGRTSEVENSFSGFYDFSYLQEKVDIPDEYGLFLSGTNAVTRISLTDGPPRPALMLFKDSFALSLAPFLALHFDIVMLDLAQARDILLAGNTFHADAALVCANLENLVTSGALSQLRNAAGLFSE